jgi:ketosteroid isomerase-like protein
MTAEQLALIHQVYDAMNRQDLEALRRLGEEHPEYRWRNAPDMPESGLRDREAGMAYVEDLFRQFDLTHTEIEQVVELGDDRAAFVVHHRVRGAQSGAEATRREVHLWHVRDDQVVGMTEYLTLEEARAAAAE